MRSSVQLPISLVLVVLLIVGFITTAAVYFYIQALPEKQLTAENTDTFNGEVTKSGTSAEVNKKIDELTVPAEPKNRLQYPSNTYIVQPKEALFTVGEKLGLPWSLIKKTNGLTSDSVQANQVLAIPKISTETDYYRLNFTINEIVATELNIELRNQTTNERFDPVAMAKKYGEPYFGLKENDEYTLVERDKSRGVATVKIEKGDGVAVIMGLVQPKIIGENGLWAVSYIEYRDDL